MEMFTDEDRAQLVERLSSGFAALLKQVNDLKHHNEAMEKLLGNEKKVLDKFARSEREAQEQAVLDGVEAFKALKCKDRTTAQDKGSSNANDIPQRIDIPQGHPPIERNESKTLSCPFAALAKEQPTERVQYRPLSPLSHRPNSPPTPPDTGERYTVGDEAQLIDQSPAPPAPAPPSVTGSISKCPIRLLDERPPEEIAEYFEIHKHEIPRSHEVCVKRYQSNEQSIRLLDAKYGNLVNMIQGLGMKHQPLLPHNDEGVQNEGEEVDEAVENRLGDGSKVENWVGGVGPEDAEYASNDGAGPAIISEREGRFDRPLKEIRVGESPSRPWGIPVPGGAATQIGDILSDRPGPESKPKSMKVEPSSLGRGMLEDVSIDSAKKSTANVVFNGPVFIGYPPEQAAAFLKQVGVRK